MLPTPPDPRDGLLAKLICRLQKLPVPRCLAELRLTNEEYSELLKWASALSSRRVRDDLVWGFGQRLIDQEVWRSNEFLGLGLFVVVAEVARREASEGTLWRFVSDRFPTCRDELFTRNGQPTQPLKDALEAAARRGYLRHVFGTAGTQEWYLSIFLQFGFTAKAIAQIPYWLSGHPKTKSVAILLGEAEEHSVGACPAFEELWDRLLQLRQRNRTAEQIKGVTAKSPFVLAEWVDRIIEQAMRPVERELTPGGTCCERDIEIFDTPYLKWPAGEQPGLCANCKNLAFADLATVGHKVKIDGTDCGYLSYDPERGHFLREDLSLPNRLGSCMVELECEGKSVWHQELPLWSLDEEVSVFRAHSGRKVDPGREPMRQSEPYYIAVASDIGLSPEPVVYYRDADSPVHIYRLEAPWPVDLRASLEGFEIWRPVVPSRSPHDPPWADGVTLSVCPERVVVCCPPGVSIPKVRVCGRWFAPRDIRFSELPTKSDYTALIPATWGSERAILRKEFSRRLGPLEMTASGWRALTTRMRITSTDLETLLVKVPAPPGVEELCLMTGDVCVRRMKGRAERLGAFCGFGGKVEVSAGRFNNPEEIAVIARCYEDQGVIIGVERTVDSLWITLSHDLTPREGFLILLLGTDGSLCKFGPESIASEGPLWLLCGLSPAQVGGWIGLSFKGERLGASWLSEHHRRIKPLESGLNPKGKAALLRWFRFPICGRDELSVVRRIAYQAPAAFLKGWLSQDPHKLDDGVELLFGAEGGEEWRAAVREVFWEWRNDDEAVSDEILSSLTPEGWPWSYACGFISETDPLLACRILQPKLRTDPGWLGSLGELMPGNEALERFRAEAASVVGADVEFLRRLIERTPGTQASSAFDFLATGQIREPHCTNLKRALQSGAFRRYLFLRFCRNQGSYAAAQCH